MFSVSCCLLKVSEDPNLLQHVKDFLLKFSKPICSKKPFSAAYKDDNGKELMTAKSDNEIVEVLAMENLYCLTGVNFDGKAVNGIQRKTMSLALILSMIFRMVVNNIITKWKVL